MVRIPTSFFVECSRLWGQLFIWSWKCTDPFTSQVSSDSSKSTRAAIFPLEFTVAFMQLCQRVSYDLTKLLTLSHPAASHVHLWNTLLISKKNALSCLKCLYESIMYRRTLCCLDSYTSNRCKVNVFLITCNHVICACIDLEFLTASLFSKTRCVSDGEVYKKYAVCRLLQWWIQHIPIDELWRGSEVQVVHNAAL